MSAALFLLAGGILAWPLDAVTARRLARLTAPSPPRSRGRPKPLAAAAGGLALALLVGGAGGAVAGTALAAGGWWALRRAARPRAPAADVTARLRLAGTLDLLAACLHAGLPVPTALEAVSDSAPAKVAVALRSAAGLLALGAGPDQAWAHVRAMPGLDELAVAAIRTSRSGAAFAASATDLATRLREGLATEAEERAERAGVLLTLPVGLCFLPAFFCLGVVPVVLGLVGRLDPLF